MRFEWIILLLSLMLPVMIANDSSSDISMRKNNSVNAIEKQDLSRSHRFKRQYSCAQCSGGGAAAAPAVISPCAQCSGGGAAAASPAVISPCAQCSGGGPIGGSFGGGGADGVAVVCCGGAGMKEMLRNWWLHIPLLLLPISMSWIKALFF